MIDFDGLDEQIDEVAQNIAKAALGIPDSARLVGMNVTEARLLILIDKDGIATIRAKIPKRDAIRYLRTLAKYWEKELDD